MTDLLHYFESLPPALLYALIAVFAVHAAGNSLGTKNDARRPIVAQYARSSGIHRMAVRGCISDAAPLALWASPATTAAGFPQRRPSRASFASFRRAAIGTLEHRVDFRAA